MKQRILILFLFIIELLSCSAQSTELANVLSEVNNTLKNYIIGTDEFHPYDIKEYGDRFMFKKFEVSIDYPNFILKYKIGGRIPYPGWVSSIKEGSYKLIIPITSNIQYPASYEIFGTTRKNEYQIAIINDSGIEKLINDKTSIIKKFTIYGDEILTTKKLAEFLKQLQETVLSENFTGQLSNNKGKSRKSNNSHSTNQRNIGKKTKSGKYGQ